MRPFRDGLSECRVAVHGAEANCAALPADERDPALVADVGAALDADTLCGVSLKQPVTPLAFSQKATVWERTSHARKQVSEVGPSSIIRSGVAWTAESDEVLDGIGFFVAVEQTERLDVVHGQAFNRTTGNASAAVPGDGEEPLRFPTRPAIASMSASPRRVFVAGQLPFECHDVSIAPSGGLVKCY